MACRDEVLAAAQSIVEAKGRNEFTPKEVIDFLRRQGTVYMEKTIQTHVVSRLCVNAPNHHAVVYQDFERIARGIYRVLRV